MPTTRLLLRDLFLACGLGALLLGLARHPPEWATLLLRLFDHGLMAAAALTTFVLLAWRVRQAPAALAWLAGLPLLALVMVGLPGLAATSLLLLGGLALGSLVLPAAGVPVLVRWVAGLGLLAGIVGWTLPFPVHYAPTWGLALAGLLAWRRKAVAAELRALAQECRHAAAEAPRTALAVAVLALVATVPAWLPVRMADDTAYHLGLAWELREYAHARFDLGTQIWALAPWSTDVLHALVMLLAQRETIGPLNAFWLLATAWLLRGVAIQLGLSPRWAWLAVAAWVSLPMTHMLAGSMQVESAAPAWFTALAAVLLARQAPPAARLPAAALLAGILLGIKASHGLLLLPFGLWMTLQWRNDLPWRGLPTATALAILAGGSSYAYAAWVAGNPLFPLANGVFAAPGFPAENWYDPTWTAGLAWNLPWRLVFEPGAYHEGGFAGSAGYLLLAGLGGLILSLGDPRRRALGLATIAGLASLLAVVQYLRYLQPLMPLLLLLMVAGFATPAAGWRGPALAAVVALQVLVLPTASWSLMDRTPRVLLREGPEAVLLRTFPERLLAGRFRALAAPGEVVLFAEPAHGAMAELPGHAISASWHSETVWGIRRLGEDWPAMVEAAGATHVVARDTSIPPALRDYLATRGATEVDRAGPAVLYALPSLPADVTVESAIGETVRVSMPLDPGAPTTGRLEVSLRCSEPGGTVGLKWSLPRPGRPDLERWNQVHCGHDGQARSMARFDSLATQGTLVLEAKLPTEVPGPGLELIEAKGERRRDPFADTERYHAVWDALCARPGCARQRTRLLFEGER